MLKALKFNSWNLKKSVYFFPKRSLNKHKERLKLKKADKRLENENKTDKKEGKAVDPNFSSMSQKMSSSIISVVILLR